jgi:lipopolysaccharide biosynthesis protein
MKNCILLHLHHQYLWPEFWSYLKYIKDENLDIIATVHTTETEFYSHIKNNVDDIFLIENKGVDFGGFLYAYNKIKNNSYKTITKLHGKKRSTYKSHTLGVLNAEQWRKNLYTPLIQNEYYTKMMNCFEKDKKIFMYGSKDCFRKEQKDHLWAIQNISAFKKINDILNLSEPQEYNFIAGSIFTVSKNYLDNFLKNKEMEIFQIMETNFPNNGTIAHGLERLIGSHISAFGGKIQLD